MSARRRGAPASAPQPQQGVAGSRFQNSNGQAYGYTQPGRLNNNYPGGYGKTGYGYAGQSAYRPSSGMGMGSRMAMAGVGGLALGFGAAYMFSRWNSYGRCRSHDDSYHGSCDQCYSRYNNRCSPDRLDRNANRDDLMQMGFWPDDWISPLTVTITAVTGTDFAQSLICPPAIGWNESEGQDIFMTLTKVAGLADKLARDSVYERPERESSVLSSLLGLILFCCCCGALAGIAAKFFIMRKPQHPGMYEDQYGNPQYGAPPPQYGQQYAQDPYGAPPQFTMQQQYGQSPQYGMQPQFGGMPPQYGGQPGHDAAWRQGGIVMGNPVGQPPPVVMGTVVGSSQGQQFGQYQPGQQPQYTHY